MHTLAYRKCYSVVFNTIFYFIYFTRSIKRGDVANMSTICTDVIFYMRLDTIITIICVNNQEACRVQELNLLMGSRNCAPS